MKLIHPLAVVLCAAVVSAQTGSNCVFNSTLCTCLFGNAEGDCWDPVTGRRGFCAKRVCDAGWTCDCDGDYYCHRGPTTVSLVDPANVDSNPAACRTVNNEIRINVAGCKLGNFRPLISAKGFNAGQCQNWQWFFNGASQNSFSYDSGRQPADRNAMARWEDLPLKPGDVIAHRFKNEWEECYEGAFLSVNGTSSGLPAAKGGPRRPRPCNRRTDVRHNARPSPPAQVPPRTQGTRCASARCTRKPISTAGSTPALMTAGGCGRPCRSTLTSLRALLRPAGYAPYIRRPGSRPLWRGLRGARFLTPPLPSPPLTLPLDQDKHVLAHHNSLAGRLPPGRASTTN